jgi:hypothetical protein
LENIQISSNGLNRDIQLGSGQVGIQAAIFPGPLN